MKVSVKQCSGTFSGTKWRKEHTNQHLLCTTRPHSYDIMLDRELRPWLIEVNHSPSFNIDSPMDLAVKEELITDTIALVCGGDVC